MIRPNFEDAMNCLTDMLKDKTADYLDVNRQHINIFMIYPNVIGEDIINWDNDPDDAAEGEEFETYYGYAYQYREDIKNIEWGEPIDMVWLHKDNGYDQVMTEEEFDKRFEAKKTDICSEFWYEGDK